MEILTYTLKLLAHPLYWIVYLRFSWAVFLRLRATWLNTRLAWTYEPYRCGASLVRQIRPDVGDLHSRAEAAQAAAERAFDGARAAWDRLP